MQVNRAALGPLEELAEGGFGKVYRARLYHLPSDPSPIAFKESTTKVTEQGTAAKNAVLFRELLKPSDRADLDRCTVWPRAVVVERGTVVGLLMPLISDEFFFDLIDPAT